MASRMLRTVFGFTLAVLLGATAFGAVGSRAGRFVVDEPTFVCLGFEWYVTGDDNADAAVKVRYRKAGDTQWREAMDLFRVTDTRGLGKVPEGQVLFAGSIFYLEPGTGYEVSLTLHDPDGGDAEKTVTVQTRREPVLPDGMVVKCVVPGSGGGKGTKDDPFRGLAAADKAAGPGDIMQIASGVYEGTFHPVASGTPEKPILWHGPDDHSAVIDGGWAERAISATGISHVWFEHLTIRSARWGFVAHESSYTLLRRCHILDVDNGYAATENPMRGNVVSDNVFDGRVPWVSKGRHMTPYTRLEIKGKRYNITDMSGIDISGEGTIACYNLIRHFGDAVHGSGDQPKVANDIYGNEIIDCPVDGIEADEGAQNVRVFNNRMTNVFQGISAQPVYGGPVYFFRNAMYNVNVEPFKLHNSPIGVLIFNNTSVRSGRPGPMVVWTGGQTPITNIFAYNNIFAGGTKQNALEISAPIRNCHFDYNCYAGGPFANCAKWNGARYRTLADFRKRAGQELHGLICPPKGLFASGVLPPKSPEGRFPLEVNDLRPASASKAVDAGKIIPNITDGYEGAAPDMGAYELGAPLPHYGPRPLE
ncbi:MAG: hypothetical protein J7M19_04850 [Planctomycetes bacterium]|nr:hypothetical protein [Planctomycetota bacterium]